MNEDVKNIYPSSFIALTLLCKVRLWLAMSQLLVLGAKQQISSSTPTDNMVMRAAFWLSQLNDLGCNSWSDYPQTPDRTLVHSTGCVPISVWLCQGGHLLIVDFAQVLQHELTRRVGLLECGRFGSLLSIQRALTVNWEHSRKWKWSFSSSSEPTRFPKFIC